MRRYACPAVPVPAWLTRSWPRIRTGWEIRAPMQVTHVERVAASAALGCLSWNRGHTRGAASCCTGTDGTRPCTAASAVTSSTAGSRVLRGQGAMAGRGEDTSLRSGNTSSAGQCRTHARDALDRSHARHAPAHTTPPCFDHSAVTISCSAV